MYTHTHTSPSLCPSLSHMHTYSLSPPPFPPPSLPLPALSLPLSLNDHVTTKTLWKHIHVGVGEWGGGGWRLQKSYWQKAVMNKWVLSLDLNSRRVEVCKWVLSLDLNSRRVEEFLRLDGREFQTEGAWKLKDRSPNVLVLRFGTLRSFSHDEWRFCVGSYVHRVWER